MVKLNVLPLFAVLLILFFSVKVRSEPLSSNATNPIKGVVNTAGQVVKKVLPKCIFGGNMIDFYVYTREFPKGRVLHDNATIEHIRKVLLPGLICFLGGHGFLAQANETEFQRVYQRLLDVEDVIIIAVNWAEGACNGGFTVTDLLGYGKAVNNTRAVGRRFAEFYKKLVDAGICKVKNTRAFGHSLGAHVIGFTGKHIYKILNGKLEMIIGCDTAGPGFEHNKCADRLCESDATYVEAIHTTKTLGIRMPVGNVDFYVNKDKVNQPGCLSPSCSHSWSLKLLESSLLSNCSAVGTQSPGDSVSDCTPAICNKVGFNAPQYSATGKLYVEIDRKKEPFCNYFSST